MTKSAAFFSIEICGIDSYLGTFLKGQDVTKNPLSMYTRVTKISRIENRGNFQI